MGGIPFQDQIASIKKGVHLVIATPGRLIDLVRKKAINLRRCRFVCIDEADRMTDIGFENDVHAILEHVNVTFAN
jgi:ATP-dependent RNA helicase DDX41